MDPGSAVVAAGFVVAIAADHARDFRAASKPRTAGKPSDSKVIFGRVYNGTKSAASRGIPSEESYVLPDYGDTGPVGRLKLAARERATEVRSGLGDLIHRRSPKWTTIEGATVADANTPEPRPAPQPSPARPGDTSRPSGRPSTPPPPPPPMEASPTNPASFFEAADLIASVPLEDIISIQRLLKTIAEGNQRYEEAVRRLANRMQEPDVAFDSMIVDPLIGFGAYLQAGTMKAAESDAALTALLNMTVAELAESGRRAPNSRILNGGGY